MNLILYGIMIFVMSMSAAYYIDEQTTVTAEIYEKFLLRVPDGLRRFLIFSKRSSRRWFLKPSVYLEILGYLLFIDHIVLYFIVKDPDTIYNVFIANLAIVDAYVILIILPCMFYCNHKSKQFKKQKKKQQRK